MTREEAIKVAIEMYGWLKTDREREALETLIPELSESKDERIRKYLIEELKAAKSVGELKFIIPQPTREECIAYLEKQKQSFKQISDSAIWDSGLRTGIELGKEEQKSEQYDIDVLEKHITKDSISELAHTVIVRNGWEIVEKEQKPVECIKFGTEFENQVSSLLASVLNGEWEYDEGFVKHAAQSLLGYAKNEMKPDEWDKREKLFRKALQAANARIGQLFEENQKLKEQKPGATTNGKPIPTENHSVDIPLAEWSEEDENALKYIHELISWGCVEKFMNTQTAHDMRKWVNEHLRPSWKPSEEQMDRLSSIVAALRKDYCDDMADFLASIYHNLKKLM